MNKLVLFSTVAAFSLVSGMAGAVTLTNNGKHDHKVIVEMGGKKETVTVKAGATYDTQGKDASLKLGKSSVSGKGSDAFVIMHGKITAKKAETAVNPAPAAEPAKTAPAPAVPAPTPAPAAAAPAPATPANGAPAGK